VKIISHMDDAVFNYIERLKIWVDWKNYNNVEQIEYPMDHSVDDGYPVYNQRDVKRINRDPRPVIVINNTTETINTIINFKKYNPNKFYIIISNGKWDQDYYKLPINYLLIHQHFWFSEVADNIFNPYRFQFHSNNEYNFNYPKQYEFVSTVGAIKKERDFFVDRLLANYNSKNYIFRYSNKDIGLPSDQYESKLGDDSTYNFFDYVPGLEKYYHNAGKIIPITLYNQSYYHLLLEGDIDWPHQFHPTEKIVKALLSGMPFVLVGSPYFLQHIRDLGFKTYNTIWDESYDEIVDYSQRVDKILELCNNLITFDWDSHREQLIKIATHNRSCFLNIHQIVDRDFTLATQQLIQFKNERRH
jgi:hypothetical protein